VGFLNFFYKRTPELVVIKKSNRRHTVWTKHGKKLVALRNGREGYNDIGKLGRFHPLNKVSQTRQPSQ